MIKTNAGIGIIDRLEAWRLGRRAGPVHVTVYPTNRCNLRCSICWQRWSEIERQELPDDRLMRLVDECADAGVANWLFVGGGEPMVRGELMMKMMSRIRERGMNGCLQTNGTLFEEDQLEALVKMGWYRVAVSVDGPDEATNDAIRSNGSFAKATANIRRLVDMKQRLKSSLPGVCLYMTLTNLTYNRIDEMVELSHSLGCDTTFSISELIVRGKRCQELALTPEQRSRLPEHLNRAEDKARAYGLETNFSMYLSTSESENKKTARRSQFPPNDMANAVCFEPWLRIAILPDGRTGPCCSFWAADADTVEAKTLEEVWHGAYMERVRKQLIEHQPPAYCAHCSSDNLALTRQLREAYREYRSLRGGRLLVYLACKGLKSFRRDGLIKTAGRAKEWLLLQRGRQ